MRGPGLKLDLDVRRLWTCPVCHQQRRLPGDHASPLCPCRDGGVLMQLTADSRLLRRAERVTPLPYIKQPAAPKSPESDLEPQQEANSADAPAAEPPLDDFGTQLDLPASPDQPG
ncbi:MAG: hypothetical protein U0872_12335 [Planctomycetaceae bacterium]